MQSKSIFYLIYNKAVENLPKIRTILTHGDSPWVGSDFVHSHWSN